MWEVQKATLRARLSLDLTLLISLNLSDKCGRVSMSHRLEESAVSVWLKGKVLLAVRASVLNVHFLEGIIIKKAALIICVAGLFQV